LLADRDLTPFLVVHPDLREDFSELRTGAEEAVVIGDAGEFFTYDLLNRAYRKITQGAAFVAAQGVEPIAGFRLRFRV
jgi:hypothetical protein